MSEGANKQMKVNEIKNTKIIYSKRVALELRNKGFKIIKTVPNKYKPQFDAYIFESTQELQEALDVILG